MPQLEDVEDDISPTEDEHSPELDCQDTKAQRQAKKHAKAQAKRDAKEQQLRDAGVEKERCAKEKTEQERLAGLAQAKLDREKAEQEELAEQQRLEEVRLAAEKALLEQEAQGPVYSAEEEMRVQIYLKSIPAMEAILGHKLTKSQIENLTKEHLNTLYRL